MKAGVVEAINTVSKGFVRAILKVNPGGVGSGGGQIHGFAYPSYGDTNPNLGDNLQPQIDGRVFGGIMSGCVFIEVPHGFNQCIDVLLAGWKVLVEK